RGEWEVSEDQPHALAHALLDVEHDRIRLPAVGALIIAVFDQCHLGRGKTLDVVAIGNGEGQDWLLRTKRHWKLLFVVGWCESDPRSSRADKIPSAPGLMPTGDR